MNALGNLMDLMKLKGRMDLTILLYANFLQNETSIPYAEDFSGKPCHKFLSNIIMLIASD